ncbi:ribosomal protein L31E [Bacillus pakistanensis]|uniref:Ribosomal protein L31E n=1 Tax=Rossellomorea pakistanensis TaxID=992288 RepID=A0ABS2N6L0_9BACI|nr:ribosomal protein L31E [Bacillus pakistanensis]
MNYNGQIISEIGQINNYSMLLDNRWFHFKIDIDTETQQNMWSNGCENPKMRNQLKTLPPSIHVIIYERETNI